MKIARHVRRLTAYTPGEQPRAKKVVKLNTNENPYPPSPEIKRVLATWDLDGLRRYPDPECRELRLALAEFTGAKPEAIFVGNGSDEILSLMAKAFVENDETIVSLDPSYSLYQTLAAIRNVKWAGAGLDAKIKKAALFLLTNPNAPTGEFREVAAIAKLTKSFKGVVVVDEAYADFARDNCMRLATQEDNCNLIVMRTFSKSFSLAGLRVGYCVGPKDLIDALYKIKDSYNVDALAQAVALAAVKDAAWMRKNAAKVIASRKRFTSALQKRGWDVMASESNFVFAKPAAPKNAAEIFQALRERNIFVRYFTGAKTQERLRITIGTESQMNKLLKAIDELYLQK